MDIKVIEKDINERMSKYTDSRQPTNDEVTIAWLIMEVTRLQTLLIKYAPHGIQHLIYPTATLQEKGKENG